jgi:hypothetical protein
MSTDERLKDFTMDQLAAELTARRTQTRAKQQEELARIGGELSLLVKAFEQCSGWKLTDWRTWNKPK